MTNMERCLSYTKNMISERPQILKCDRGLKNWPSKGEIIFEMYVLNIVMIQKWF